MLPRPTLKAFHIQHETNPEEYSQLNTNQQTDQPVVTNVLDLVPNEDQGGKSPSFRGHGKRNPQQRTHRDTKMAKPLSYEEAKAIKKEREVS